MPDIERLCSIPVGGQLSSIHLFRDGVSGWTVRVVCTSGVRAMYTHRTDGHVDGAYEMRTLQDFIEREG